MEQTDQPLNVGSMEGLGVTRTSTLAGLWPHLGADEHGCATMEWWNGARKLTLYTVGHVHESLLKTWGPNMQTEMQFVPLTDAHAVREAFQWLADAPPVTPNVRAKRGPTA
jgi:hypothetical protein